MTELLKRINRHLGFLMDCAIEPRSIRISTQKLIDEINAITNKPISNADRIRQMTDEELRDFLDEVTDCCFSNNDCDNCPMKYSDDLYYRCNIEVWLKQEVKDDAEH